jgi:3-oxoacyl-[acyl-carrier protein] reductase
MADRRILPYGRVPMEERKRMRLQNKVAIITGAGSGLGQCMAETFAREGAEVAVVDLNEQAAKAVADSIGRSALAIRCDVTKKSDIDAAMQATLRTFGKLDILVNNAGTTHFNKPMLDIDGDEFDRVFAVNVKGVFLFSQAAIPALRENGGGVIVNIGSTAAVRPRPGLSCYNASKGAVHLLSKTMAAEFAADKIRVCTIAPVATETPLLPTFLGGDDPEKRAKFVATVPLGRLGRPQDIANAALFLASDDAAFITGNVLEVDGGRCV